MRTIILCLALCAVGCGGEDAATIGGDGGSDGTAADGTVNDGGGSDATSADASATDAQPQGDATAGDAGLPPNGTPPDPGKVACGGSSCTLPQSCCVTSTLDGGATQTCGGGCNLGVQLECDEAKDCPPAPLPDGGTAPQVCCYERAGQAIVGSSCHRDCAGGGGNRTQACRTNGECLTGTCAVRSCTGSIKSVETCNAIPNVCP